MTDQKSPPPYIVMAFEALSRHKEHIKPDEQGRLKKILPVYAAIIHREGLALSPAIFDSALAKGCAYIEGYNQTHRKKPKQETGLNYQDIVKQFPKPQKMLDKEFFEAIKSADFDTAKKLFKQGADTLADDKKAFGWALRHGDAKRLSFLFAHGVNPGDFDSIGFYLQQSINHEVLGCKMPIIKLLIKWGADPKANDSHAMRTAVVLHEYKLVKLLLTFGADAQAKNSRALEYSDFEMAKLLIEHGADPSDEGCSAAAKAVRSLNAPLLELLIAHGANPNLEYPIYSGAVAKTLPLLNLLHNLSTGEGDREKAQEILRLCLEQGADPLIYNKVLDTAWSGSLYKEFDLILSYCTDRSLLSDKIRQHAQWREQWQVIAPDLLSRHSRLHNKSPYYFERESFDTAYGILKDYEGIAYALTALEYAYNASGLFQSEDRLLRYLKRWGKYGSQPLHDIIQNIKIPQGGEPDLKAWGDAVMAQGPKMARFVQYADRLTQPMKDASGKGWSYNNTKAEVAKYRYENGEKAPALAQYCSHFSWPETDFNKGLELIEAYSEKYAANDNKKGGAIPEITIAGKAFDKEGYRFRRLDDGDVKGLLLGEFTNCCQHLGNQGSSCAKHGFLSENGGFYVVESEKKGEIVAQSWAWRGDKGELVFDSLESLSGHFNTQQWKALCTEFSLKLKEHAQALSIPSFHIGTSGGTPRDIKYPAALPAKPIDYNGYRDSNLQHLVASY